MPYRELITFGATPANSLPVFNNDPVTMCVGTEPTQRFNHGGDTSAYGQNSPECQVLLAQKCSANWDEACEMASNQNGQLYSRNVSVYTTGNDNMGRDSGDLMVMNTAMEKYRVSMRTNPYGSHQCIQVTEQFNSLNPASPILTHYEGDCLGEYAVDPTTIDMDPVMNKILARPFAFMPLLRNIHSTMTRMGTIGSLLGTKLGNFFRIGQPIPVAVNPVYVVPTYNAYSYPRYRGPRRIPYGIRPHHFRDRSRSIRRRR